MTERKMYAISSGDYSDYRVAVLVETKEEAEKLCEKMNRFTGGFYPAYRVEEYDVADSSAERMVILLMQEVLLDGGGTREAREDASPDWPWDVDQVAVKWRWVRAPYLRGQGGRLEVSGADHELVRKVFAEKKAALQSDDALRAQVEMKGRGR